MTNHRIVVFSDVQGNSVALQAMFEYLKNLSDFESLDFICLGDIACAYAPNTVLDLLREYHVQCIRGNMDDVILNPQVYTGDDADEIQYNEIDLWAAKQLTVINRDFLADTKPQILETRFDNRYGFFHGSSANNTVALRHDMPQYELTKYMSDLVNIQFTGHTHQQFMLPVEQHTLINPGSIGFPDPLENGKRPLRAQFVILDEGRFDFVTLTYKREDFTFAVIHSGMPHFIWYLSLWDI